MNEIHDFALKINLLRSNIFFVNLRQSKCCSEFVHTHFGFLKAIEYWSKCLSQMLVKATTDRERLVFIENLYDEHGNGNLENSHTNTFIKLIMSLDSKSNLSLENCTKSMSYKFAVNAFINKLQHAMDTENFQFCCGMLGIIEYIYMDASKEIHNYLLQYLPLDEINHYSLHEILDKKHLDDLFSLIDIDNMSDAKNGMLYGYNAMWKMYQSMSLFFPINNSV